MIDNPNDPEENGQPVDWHSVSESFQAEHDEINHRFEQIDLPFQREIACWRAIEPILVSIRAEVQKLSSEDEEITLSNIYQHVTELHTYLIEGMKQGVITDIPQTSQKGAPMAHVSQFESLDVRVSEERTVRFPFNNEATLPLKIEDLDTQRVKRIREMMNEYVAALAQFVATFKDDVSFFQITKDIASMKINKMAGLLSTLNLQPIFPQVMV